MSEKMSLMEFADYVEKNIRDYLPESLRDAEIQCRVVDKPGYYDRDEDPMVGLTIRSEGVSMAPVVYLKSHYKEYQGGEELQSVLAGIAAKSAGMELPLTGKELADFVDMMSHSPEKLLPLVRPRLCPKSRVPDSFVSKPCMDLAEIYYLNFENQNLTCTIHKPLLQRMGLTAARIEEAAKENMRKDGPVLFKMKDLTEILMLGAGNPKNLLDSSFFESDVPSLPGTEPGDGLDLFVLTNKEKIFGAAYLADKDLHQRLYKAFGEYFVLPSSVHELLILPNRGAAPYDAGELRGMVREVNMTQVAENEVLSNNVYVNRGEGVKPVFGEQIHRERSAPRHRGR